MGSVGNLRSFCSLWDTGSHVKWRLHVNPPTALPLYFECSKVLSLIASTRGQSTAVRFSLIRDSSGSSLRWKMQCIKGNIHHSTSINQSFLTESKQLEMVLDYMFVSAAVLESPVEKTVGLYQKCQRILVPLFVHRNSVM